MKRALFIPLAGGTLRTDNHPQAGVWFLPEEAKRAEEALALIAKTDGACFVVVRQHDLELQLSRGAKEFRSAWPYVLEFVYPAPHPGTAHCVECVEREVREVEQHWGSGLVRRTAFIQPTEGGMTVGTASGWLPGDPVDLPAPAPKSECSRCAYVARLEDEQVARSARWNAHIQKYGFAPSYY